MKILSAVVAIIFFAVGATAETTDDLSDAEIQGRQLAQKLLEQSPAGNSTNTGVLQIRDTKGKTTEVPIKCEIIVTPTNWLGVYTSPLNSWQEWLRIIHSNSRSNSYVHFASSTISTSYMLPMAETSAFANSDFWIADLGLEFFHWPEQKILKKENRRSRACNVLESTNPNPSTNGYSRVVSWIDEESGGIVHAEAYDAQNKLLKEFDPKTFKKVNGQWELQEMEIRNVQTGSRSRIEFDLKKN